MKRTRTFLSVLLTLALALGLCSTALAGNMAKPGVGSTLSAGDEHSLAIGADGSLWAWGKNFYGTFGNGTKEDRYVPTKVMDGVASVAAGYLHSMLLKTDGTLWTCGANNYGQLGDKVVNKGAEPGKVMDDVASISAGYWHSLAVKTDGTLWAWGANDQGQLGIGVIDRPLHSNPQQVLDDVTAAAAGAGFSAAIKKDGSLWIWGGLTRGSAEADAAVNRNSPGKAMDNVAAVSAGGSHILVLKTDGTLWTWGSNNAGQIGNGTESTDFRGQATPVQVLDNVASIAAGSVRSFAVKTDGTLWAWGENNHGALGDGTTESRLSPVKVMDGVAAVSGGNQHTLILKTDGSLWACGWSYYGRLGNSVYASEKCPIPIKAMDGVLLPGTSPASTAAPTPAVSVPTIVSVGANPGPGGTAKESTQPVLIGGKTMELQAYALLDANNSPTNYVKIRDVAAMLDGTAAQFDVTWDGAINLVTKTPYTSRNGQENKTPYTGDRPYENAGTATKVNGITVPLRAFILKDDAGNGSTYYKLRDLGQALGFNVGWSADKGIFIEPDKAYDPND